MPTPAGPTENMGEMMGAPHHARIQFGSRLPDLVHGAAHTHLNLVHFPAANPLPFLSLASSPPDD